MGQREGYERVLRLAAYVSRHRQGVRLVDLQADVPGYRDLEGETLRKAVQRDCAVLEESLGIALDWDEGKRSYALRPPMFSGEERRALIAAAAAVDVEGLDHALSTSDLGAAVERDLAQVIVRVHARVLELRDAIKCRRTVAFTYQAGGGDANDRRVDPYAIGLWRNRWYFIGFDHEHGARRVFRLDRIVTNDGEAAIRPCSEPDAYVIPGDVDPISDLRMDPNAWGSDPPCRARVHVSRDVVPMFLGELGGTVGESDTTAAIVELDVRDYESFVIRLLGFGTAVELLEPAQLVDHLRAWLARQVR